MECLHREASWLGELGKLCGEAQRANLGKLDREGHQASVKGYLLVMENLVWMLIGRHGHALWKHLQL